MSTDELIERVRRGDESAFEALMLANHRRLYLLAYGILRDAALAEDATQQAFLDIWRDIRRLRDASRFEAWSYRLLVRVCYRETRRRTREVAAVRSLTAGASNASDPSTAVIDRDELEQAFALLSIDHRVAIVMRYLLDMSPERIAETLGVPRRTVYTRLDRGRQAMRAALEADSRLPTFDLIPPEAPR